MDFAGNAVIQVVFGGIGAIAEVIGVGHHGSDQGRVHIIHHVPLAAAGRVDEEIVLIVGLGRERVLEHLDLLFHGHLQAHFVRGADVGGEGHKPLRQIKVMEELMPAGVAAPGEAGEGAVIAGGDEARLVRGFGVGAVGAFHGGHDVVAHFLGGEGFHVDGTGFVVVVVGGEHHDEGCGDAHFDHVIQGVLGLFVANEAVLGFVGAVEEIDHVVAFGAVFIVTVGQVHIHPSGLLRAVGGSDVVQAHHGAGLGGCRVVELVVVLLEHGLRADHIIGGDDLFVLGLFPAFRQGGEGAQDQRQRAQQSNELLHGVFSFSFDWESSIVLVV